MKTEEQIRIACSKAIGQGIKVESGAWFDRSGGAISSCCALGAVLLSEGAVSESVASALGYMVRVCQILDVDEWWVHRFLMGFDRGYQITIEVVKNGSSETTRDEVSRSGIQLRKELLKNK